MTTAALDVSTKVRPMKKAPNQVDRHVGGRVRMRRMMIKMSQEKLGDALGLTFQQVQKYEKGTNRIGASRLQQIANVLGVPVDFFFTGAPGPDSPAEGFSEAASPSYEADLLTAEGLKLLRAFHLVKDPKVRRRLVELTQALSGAEVELAASAVPE
jgi:transcriptional regulator with XRE-family HTH domain